jgi:TldD protein
MKISEDVVSEAEKLVETLKTDDHVAYAEAGAIFRDTATVLTVGATVERSSEISESGVWCRVFADGAAGYRYTADIDHVSNIGTLARKRAQVLGQSAAAQYDTTTAHRGTHTGWATDGRNTDTDLDAKIETIRAKSGRFRDCGATRIHYKDVSRDDIILTTTGGAIRTSIDRNWVDIRSSVGTKDGNSINIRQQSGNTLGFQNSGDDLIDSTVDKISEQKARMSRYRTADPPGAETVVLSGSVAGQLFHEFSRYLEMDTVYFGSSAVEVGDTVTSELITIDDTIKPGDWAAIAFDAEGRATSPLRLVSNGVVKNRLHSAATALAEGEQPGGHFIFSTNPESPPRIHSRHLDIKSGSTPEEEMLVGGDVYIKSVGAPALTNEATETKQSSKMPPSALYARDIADQTPEDYSNEATEQSIHLPVTEGYVLEGGEKTRLLSDASLIVSLEDLKTISEVGISRSTVSGTDQKNNSRIPFSAMSPAIALDAELR